LKKIIILLIFVLIFLSVFAIEVANLQNPKALMSKTGVSYNEFYGVLEIENKLSNNFYFINNDKINFGLFFGATLFTQAPDDLLGHYAVMNIFGMISFFSEFQINEKIDLIIYPLYHESSHYTDGLLKSPSRTDGMKNSFTREEMEGISQECVGFDIRHKKGGLNLYYGAGYYYHSTSRSLKWHSHIAEDYYFSIDNLPLVVASDFAIISEKNGISYPVNIGFGLSYKNYKILLKFERQRGLGRDYRNLQKKIGVEVIFVP